MTYIKGIQKLLHDYHNYEEAQTMAAYMRKQFAFLGIRAPKRLELSKEYLQRVGLPTKSQLSKVIEGLWLLPEREFQYFALTLLAKMKQELSIDDLKLLERLIITKSWWDTVDILAPNIIGSLLADNPSIIAEYNKRWINADNLWLKRTAIIFQLRYKEETNTELMFANIIDCQQEKEFFIQKAMGWALREYAKTDLSAIQNFIHNNNALPALTKREALRRVSCAD